MFKKILISFVCVFMATTHANADWSSHWLSRASTIQFHVNTAGTQRMVIIGDSNTEAFWWNQNAGCRVINAGLGGARISNVAAYANAIAAATLPKVAHIMVGTNNIALSTSSAEWAATETDLKTIVNAFKSRGAVVVLWDMPPFDPSFGDQSKRVAINSVVASVAAQLGVYYDWWWDDQITASNGYAAAGSMLGDGVHFSPSTQVSRFHRLEVWKNHIQADAGVNCAG